MFDRGAPVRDRTEVEDVYLGQLRGISLIWISGNLSLNLSLYLHAKSDILEDIGNVLHEASAGIVVVGFVSNIFINVAERR